ncbi:Asp23/Gls24 family envelope stress response protein [Geodermatophilus sp. DF01-2]|uniref:Asp23/Gls24 family envelope stress response protein n=1 Tax=Geodermatophilus sp. DF01-2 TaxID=2559610 RepID=UPI0010749628|nr:Asp23/Gls24 family envelope stress response protein [Geodermatophilus sp. DF01_2]TFV64138.1 Asp23/Gls24 family envelope stress response protein [Geodermatophilus sp. DF01_2]
MSTAVTPGADAAPAGTGTVGGVSGSLPELGDPADRGSLTVADRVVERVAGYAVTQVEGASAAPRRLLGVSVGDVREDKEASVDARVDGHIATVDATVAIGWPASIRTVAARIRQRIREDVELMTGVRVAQVDIDVVSLSAPSTHPRRVQ